MKLGAEERNMELMQTLDDAWNAQDLDTFAKRNGKWVKTANVSTFEGS